MLETLRAGPGREGDRSQVQKVQHQAGRTLPAVQAAAQLSQTVAALKSAFAARSFSGADAFAMVDAISAKAINDRFTDYSGSQQAVMGVDTLLNAMVSSGRITVGAAAGIRADIDRAYTAVRDPNAFRPADFQASLGSAVCAIGALR